jgi:hypothetical protein
MIGVSRLSMAQLDQSNIFGAFLSLFQGKMYFYKTSWSYIKSLKLENWFGSNEIIWHQLCTHKGVKDCGNDFFHYHGDVLSSSWSELTKARDFEVEKNNIHQCHYIKQFYNKRA